MTPRKRATRRQLDEMVPEIVESAGDAEHVGGEGREDEPTEEELGLDEVVAELAGEAEYVVIWRLDGPGRKLEHVDKVGLTRFSSDYVREHHGGGDYLMRAYGPKLRGGRRTVKKYKEFSIDKSVPPKTGSAAMAWKEKQPATTVGPQRELERRDGMPKWLQETLLASVPTLIAGVVTVLTREKTTDPLLVELIRNNGKGNGTDPIELQKLLADERDRAIKLGQQMGSRRRDSDDGNDTVSMLSEGMDVLGKFAEGYRAKAQAEAEAIRRGEGSTTDASDPTQYPVGNGGGSAAVDLESARHPDIPVPATLPPSTLDHRPVTDRLWVRVARPHIGALKLMAGFVQPETAAQAIGDVLDDDAFNDLLVDIDDNTDGGILGRLAVYFPELATVNVEWAARVMEAIRASTMDDDDEDDDAGIQIRERESRRDGRADSDSSDVGGTTTTRP